MTVLKWYEYSMLPAIFGPFSIAKNNEVQIYRILTFSESWRSASGMQHRPSKTNRV
jgi:hypothetical protein